MRLPRRGERVFDADVKLASLADCKPDATTRAQRLGLFELLQAKQIAEEAARLRLAARRRGELDVV
jgi:hypothetical protein